MRCQICKLRALSDLSHLSSDAEKGCGIALIPQAVIKHANVIVHGLHKKNYRCRKTDNIALTIYQCQIIFIRWLHCPYNEGQKSHTNTVKLLFIPKTVLPWRAQTVEALHRWPSYLHTSTSLTTKSLANWALSPAASMVRELRLIDTRGRTRKECMGTSDW